MDSFTVSGGEKLPKIGVFTCFLRNFGPSLGISTWDPSNRGKSLWVGINDPKTWSGWTSDIVLANVICGISPFNTVLFSHMRSGGVSVTKMAENGENWQKSPKMTFFYLNDQGGVVGGNFGG